MKNAVMVNFEHAVDAWFPLRARCRQGKVYFTDQRVVGGHRVLSLKNAEADTLLAVELCSEGLRTFSPYCNRNLFVCMQNALHTAIGQLDAQRQRNHIPQAHLLFEISTQP